MKKIYEKPMADIVVFETDAIMSLSGTGDGGEVAAGYIGDEGSGTVVDYDSLWNK